MGSSGGSGVSALTSSSRPGRRQHHQPGSGGQAAAPRQQQQQQQQRGKAVVARAIGDFFKDLFDLNSWAPKSTRVWRLQQYKPPGSEDEDGQEGAGQGSGSSSSGSGSGSPLGSADSLDVLQARISALRDSQGSSPLSSRGGSSSSASSSATAEYDGFLDADDALQPASMASFSDAEDADVAQALNARIRTIATTTGEWGSSQEEEEMRQPLSGEVRRCSTGCTALELRRCVCSGAGRVCSSPADVSCHRGFLMAATLAGLTFMYFFVCHASHTCTCPCCCRRFAACS